MIAYAFVTNILLMTLYSANNMPYSALGGVMTGDVVERAKLNSFRFIAAITRAIRRCRLDAAAGFQIRRPRARPTTRLANDNEPLGRLVPRPVPHHVLQFPRSAFIPNPNRKRHRNKTLPICSRTVRGRSCSALTLIHFSLIALMGSAQYNYYNYYADKAAFFDWLQKLHLTAPRVGTGCACPRRPA